MSFDIGSSYGAFAPPDPHRPRRQQITARMLELQNQIIEASKEMGQLETELQAMDQPATGGGSK